MYCMKILGIDYGTKRIGLALSDDGGEFAFPYSIVASEEAIQKIIELISHESVVNIVVGYSVASNGVENDTAHKAKNFKEKLETATSIPIYFEREDFSSFEAHRYQTKAGSRDDSAAAIILQRFLDRTKKIR